MNDVSTLLSILADNGLDIPRRGTRERDYLEEALESFLYSIENDAYANGWNSGAGVTNPYSF